MLETRKLGRAEYFKQTRARLISQLYNDMRFAYHSKTLTWKEYRELLDLMRDSFSYESLLGVKQLSIYDSLDDEEFIKYNTNPD